AATCSGLEDSSPIFYLVGIPRLPKSFFLPGFFIFLLIYLLILVGNALMLVAVVAEPSLPKLIRQPWTSSPLQPKMLSLFLLGNRFLSFPACLLRMCLFHDLNCSEAFILVVKASDRYMAICRPLRYPNNAALAASAWLSALLLPITAVIKTSQMAYSNIAIPILLPLLLPCIAMVVSLLPLLLALLSCAHILASVLRISSQEGHSKAFSTCSSHLLVVGIYYSSTAIAYMACRVDLPSTSTSWAMS
ncbi:Olfactory receptor 2AT4, partial [Galemys pyrenaicus]